MRIAKLSGAMFSIAIIAGVLGYQFKHQSHSPLITSGLAINEVAARKHPAPVNKRSCCPIYNPRPFKYFVYEVNPPRF